MSYLKKYSGINALVERTVLPLSTYFTASEILWLRKYCRGVQIVIDERTRLMVVIVSWLIYVLTCDHSYITDITNASRTMLMIIHNLDWDEEVLNIFDIPREILSRIAPFAEDFGCLFVNIVCFLVALFQE